MERAWSRRWFLAVAGGLVLGGNASAACSDDASSPDRAATLPTTGPTPAELPTNDEATLTELFDPLFAPLDQHVTRIGLYDLSRGFVRDDVGTHLAIYTEPIDPAGEGWDTTRYVESIAPNLAACTPYIFDTWPGIETMDICQEPPQEQAPEPEPPIVTQVQLARADAARIDWADVELVDLFEARERSPETVRIVGDASIRADATWQDAQAAVTGS